MNDGTTRSEASARIDFTPKGPTAKKMWLTGKYVVIGIVVLILSSIFVVTVYRWKTGAAEAQMSTQTADAGPSLKERFRDWWFNVDSYEIWIDKSGWSHPIAYTGRSVKNWEIVMLTPNCLYEFMPDEDPLRAVPMNPRNVGFGSHYDPPMPFNIVQFKVSTNSAVARAKMLVRLMPPRT